MAINLERVPKISDLHVWGDYIELLCLVSQDGIISKSDVLDRMTDQLDIDTPERDVAELEEEYDDLSLDRDDKQERKADDWFGHLEYRHGAFDRFEFYPFEISSDRDLLSLKNPLTLQHKFYIYLLIASNLKYISKSDSSKVSRKFELVSCKAFTQCLPEAAEIHVFGTSGTKYKGNLWQKIQTLADELHEKIVIEKEAFAKKDSGDNGLDIVGWLPVGDNLSNRICFFGQCTCRDDWVTKQHSSSPQAWRRIFTLAAPPGNVIFIPHCFRDSNGNWPKPQDIQESILFDRLRLIYLLQEKYDIFEEIGIYADVDRLISKHESLV